MSATERTEEIPNCEDSYDHENCSIFYTVTNIPGRGLSPALLLESLCVRCICVGPCEADCECVRFSGRSLNYVNNRLNFEKLSSNSFILECNDLCQCSLNCGNRMVQFGPRRHLSVFKTDSRGNGLKTGSLIESGGFVCEYAGELIGREEAKRRAHNDSRNYIFVLKEYSADTVTETIVDPTSVGNIGRYINHSCEPNAAIVPVRIDSPIPRLAVFSIKNIEANEEITYDYASGGSGIGETQCLCNSAQCRKFLPFDKDLLD